MNPQDDIRTLLRTYEASLNTRDAAFAAGCHMSDVGAPAPGRKAANRPTTTSAMSSLPHDHARLVAWTRSW
jgi:hypothetical protein